MIIGPTGNRTTAWIFKDKYLAEPWIVLQG